MSKSKGLQREGEKARMAKFNQVTRTVAAEMGVSVTAVQFAAKGRMDKLSTSEAAQATSLLTRYGCPISKHPS